jgi:hypothetical protein
MKLKLILFFPFLMLACVKVPSKKMNAGAEVTEDQFLEINQVMDPGGFDQLQQGDYSKIESVQSIRNQSSQLLGTSEKTVTLRVDYEDYFDIQLVTQESSELSGSSSKPTTDVLDLSFYKTPIDQATQSRSNAFLNLNQLLKLKPFNFSIINPNQISIYNSNQSIRTYSTYIKESLHNLKISDIKIQVPTAVQKRSNCGGLKSCTSMSLKEITVDRILWRNSDEFDRESLKFWVSSELPLRLDYYRDSSGEVRLSMNKLLLSCVETSVLVPEAQARFFVQQCDEMVDFNKGGL